MRARLAHLWTKRLYREIVVSDRPLSDVYFALQYGTWAKFLNYLRMRVDYGQMRTTVRSQPYVVRVEPIGKCNLHCPLCPTGAGEVDRGAGAMSADVLDAILTRCGRHALYANLWIWGEPLLNRHLEDLVAVCRRHGVGSEVSSHFSLPLRTERLDALISSGLDWLIVSNDAASAPVYDQYRVGGNFDRVIQNLRAIVERKRVLGSRSPFVEWQFVPFRHNEHEIGEAHRMAREIGVDGLRLKPCRVDKTQFAGEPGNPPAQRLAQWAPSNPAQFHAIRPGRHSYIDFHCRFLWGMVTVYADGAMAPCCETTKRSDDLGNLFEQEFDQIWNGPAYVQARRVALGLAQTQDELASVCHACPIFRKPLAPSAEKDA